MGRRLLQPGIAIGMVNPYSVLVACLGLLFHRDADLYPLIDL
jgi:hypothetical protein